MKTYFIILTAFLFIGASVPQKKKSIYIIDFHNNKEYNSMIGMNIAKEFQNVFHLCNCKYEVVPKSKYEEELEGITFEKTKRFLADQEVDFVIYGDIFQDDKSGDFMIEYIFEEVETSAIWLIETVNFKYSKKIVNASKRQKAIETEIRNNKYLCKHRNRRKRIK